MNDKPQYSPGLQERRVVYAWEGEVDGLRAEIERLRDALRQIVDRGYGGWPQEIAETALRNEKPST